MTRPLGAPLTKVLLAAICACMAACATVGPNYALPADSMFAKVQQHPVSLDIGKSDMLDPAQESLPARWWELYDDPRLNDLVAQALQANVDLRVAAGRLAQAQARYLQARGVGGFAGTAEASVARGRISAESLLQTEPLPIFNFGDASLAVSYQLDLFGKVRRGVEAATANAQAVATAGDLARITVAGSVVTAYLEVCDSRHEAEVAERSVALQQHSFDIASRLRDAGRGTQTEVERAQAQLASLRAAVPPLLARQAAARYELAALLGRTPEAVPPESLSCSDAPKLSRPIPVGDGATLLRRRPDVREAERALAAATAQIGVATAELYPDVQFGASFGSTGLLDDIGKTVTEEWSIGPLIRWSIPGRAARGRLALADAGAQLALAQFDRVVLNALRETQTILDKYAQDMAREAALTEARDHARQAASNVQRLYQAGREPYLSSLDGDRTLASAESILAAAQAQVSQDQIRLFLALGGGWQDGSVDQTAQSAASQTAAAQLAPSQLPPSQLAPAQVVPSQVAASQASPLPRRH